MATRMIDWAENTLVEPHIPESEDVEVLMDVLMYLGAADTRGFPLTWDVLSDFVARLGGSLQVVIAPA